jgi:hypothetical protein
MTHEELINEIKRLPLEQRMELLEAISRSAREEMRPRQLEFRALEDWLAANPLEAWRREQKKRPTYQVIGDHTGTTRTGVLYWLRGDYTPDEDNMKALADLMHVDWKQLMLRWTAWRLAQPEDTAVQASRAAEDASSARARAESVVTRLRGIAKPDGPLPTDEELKDDYVRYLAEKYS